MVLRQRGNSGTVKPKRNQSHRSQFQRTRTHSLNVLFQEEIPLQLRIACNLIITCYNSINGEKGSAHEEVYMSTALLQTKKVVQCSVTNNLDGIEK